MAISKVVWKDGMFVLPHHFQQMENYLLSSLRQNTVSAIPFSSGLRSWRINKEALADGILQLDEVTGVMPDGASFSLRIPEDLPSPKQVNSFVNDTAAVTAYLAIPLYWEGKTAYSDTASDVEGRFKKHEHTVTDELTGMSREKIEVARLNFQILFDGESQESFVTMPIAKIKKNVAGSFQIEDDFIPPLLRIGSSSYITDQLRTILSALKIRGTELLRARREVNGIAEFAPEETTSMNYLQIISTFLPLLEQYANIPQEITPFELNKILGQLIGALSMFTPGDNFVTLPSYDHNDFGAVMNKYREIVQGMLSTDHAPSSRSVDLMKTGQVTYECSIDGSIDLNENELFLGVTADAGEEDISRAITGLLKLTSKEMLPKLTMSAMPGIGFTPVMNPPQKLGVKDKYLYYRVDKTGAHWDSIVSDKTLAAYLPCNFTNLKLELVFVSNS